LFAPLIKVILEYIKQNINLPMYHILLILTDGCIHDMRETLDFIVECTNFPISIIIIGLGGGTYTAMRMLDSDEKMLRDGLGRVAQRDIV